MSCACRMSVKRLGDKGRFPCGMGLVNINAMVGDRLPSALTELPALTIPIGRGLSRLSPPSRVMRP